MLRVIVAVVCLAAGIVPATAADWLTVYNKDEFDGKDRYFAVTSAKDPWFGFICDAETARVRLFYKTNERSTRSLRAQMPAWASLAVIVDDQPVSMHPGKVIDIKRKIAAESYDDSIFALAKAIVGAKRRVLVAIDWHGEKVIRHEFQIAGAARAVPVVLDRCAKLKKR